MDKEEKIGVFHDDSFDPDAAELLKDLEVDDEDEAFESSPSISSPSLARVLSSAALIELSSAVPKPAVSSEDETSEQSEAKEGELLPEAEPIGKTETPSSEEPSVSVDEGGSTQAKPAIPPIKAFGEQGVDRKTSTPSKRPPAPPRMPNAGQAGAARILRQGEVAYTQETLNGMMPGGLNDEARDIAALKIVDNNWYTQVFNEDFFRTISPSSVRQTRREAKFIVEQLGIEKGARVLDLCCGYGRHTIELAKQGFDMVGLDLSMVMLKRALADAQAGNQIIKFVHGDMQKLTFKAVFDAIYNVQTSFGYFDDFRNFKVLQGVFRALKPGGVFLVETINRDFIIEDLPLRLWWKGVDCMLLEEIDMEHFTGVLKIKRSFVFEDSARAPWEQNIHIRLYTPIELRAMLLRAGFQVLELSGDYSLPGAFFGATSPRVIFVAEKAIK